MNVKTLVYSNAVPTLVEHFHVSQQAARVGQMIFLVLGQNGFGDGRILQHVQTDCIEEAYSFVADSVIEPACSSSTFGRF